MKKIFVLVIFGMFATVVWAQPVSDIREVGTVMSDDPIGNFAMTYSQELTDENQSFFPVQFRQMVQTIASARPLNCSVPVNDSSTDSVGEGSKATLRVALQEERKREASPSIE